MDDDKPNRIPLGPIDVPEHLRPHYANFLNVNHTPWDFRLVFAMIRAPMPGNETDAIADGGAVRPQAVSEIIIPANLMHGVIMALQSNFERYLAQHGVPGMEPSGPRNDQHDDEEPS